MKNTQNIFLDTNILIDVFTERETNYSYTSSMISRFADAKVFIGALSIPNVCYICKIRDRNMIKRVFSPYETISLDTSIIQTALELGVKDFEDAIQAASCLAVSDILITWNTKDFKAVGSELNVLTPIDFINS